MTLSFVDARRKTFLNGQYAGVGKETVQDRVRALTAELKEEGIGVVKVLQEYCVQDDLPGLDASRADLAAG